MYPVRYHAAYAEERSRASVFFRLILGIPWLILINVYALVAAAVAFLAWFALLFTARYPSGLYDFNAGFLRFAARSYAFFFLQTDAWPPWAFERGPQHPIQVEVDPPLEASAGPRSSSG